MRISADPKYKAKKNGPIQTALFILVDLVLEESILKVLK
jgi:hypothetical protein